MEEDISREELYHYASIAATFFDDTGSNADYIKGSYWNPLEDSRDAFDLMLRIGASLSCPAENDNGECIAIASCDFYWRFGDHQEEILFHPENTGQKEQAYRSAIVNLAYKAGKHLMDI